MAVPPKAKVPLVVTVHDLASEAYPDAFPRRGRRFHRRGLAAAARRADLVIAVSSAAAEEIAERSPIGQDRIRVVHNGATPPDMDPGCAEQMVAERGLAGRRYVLWVGSLEPRKGVGTLVAAMAEVRRRRPHDDTLTVLAGYQGWLHAGLVSPADRDILGPSLHQIGRVSEMELWALYRGASVFAYPSVYEGFGLPVLEAMTQGIPTVAADIPVMREVAGTAAVLVDPGDVSGWADAIAHLLSDEASARRFGQAGRQRSRPFTAEAMVAATRAVYLEAGS